MGKVGLNTVPRFHIRVNLVFILVLSLVREVKVERVGACVEGQREESEHV